MHLELVDLLRCTVPHEDSVLVVAAQRVNRRYIEEGLLGCPVCGAEYPIVDGVTQFVTAPARAAHAAHVDDRNATTPNAISGAAISGAAMAVAAMAVAAQLSLHENRGTFAVVGYASPVAAAMREVVPARMFVVNPPDMNDAFGTLRDSSAVAPFGIISANTLPFASAKLDGVALASSSAGGVPQAVHLLRVRGRLVAPMATALPPHMRELVRDNSVWVAEREAIMSAPVALSRKSPR